MAPNEDMRMFVADDRNSYRGERIVSPAMSPLHTHYGGGSHSRHPSDMGASALSSSPASSSGGMVGRPTYYEFAMHSLCTKLNLNLVGFAERQLWT